MIPFFPKTAIFSMRDEKNYIDYAEIENTVQAAEIAMQHFGPFCEIPNIGILGPPQETSSDLGHILNKYERFAAVRRLLQHWERGTWLFLCGFRLPHGNEKAEIVTPSHTKAIELLHRPAAVRCLAFRLGINPDNMPLAETWRQIITHDLVSDLESALLNVYTLDDLTGSGSDGMNVGGRESLFDYFNISQFNKERNKRLINHITRVRQLGQGWGQGPPCS
jgi:hypothetical protein